MVDLNRHQREAISLMGVAFATAMIVMALQGYIIVGILTAILMALSMLSVSMVATWSTYGSLDPLRGEQP